MAANYGQDYYLEKARAGAAHRRIVERGRQTRLHRGEPARGVRRRRRRHVRAVAGHGGDVRRRLRAADDGGLPRHQRHHHLQVRHRGAEEALDPRHRRRLDHHGVRDHRTRRRLELAPDHHHRPPRRQRLDPVRAEGVHLRRRPGAGGARRRSHRRGQDRQPEARAVRGAHRHPGLHVDQDRHGDRQPREPVPGVPRRRAAARRRAGRLRGRRDRAAVRRAEPGADHGRRQRGRHGPLRDRQGRRLRQDPPGVEDADRRAPGHCRIRWRRTTSRSSWPS